eukprot:Nitzschia sp. Nitz4//scaffold283_size24287//416//2234//NITZ4_008400-RA/size24287-augustus-gene-0.27-mRNA-1//1//CDS//3329545639//3891//frame0
MMNDISESSSIDHLHQAMSDPSTAALHDKQAKEIDDTSSGDSDDGPPAVIVPSDLSVTSVTESSRCQNSETSDELDDDGKKEKAASFMWFRLSYLFVTLVVMLADGLQGTHLYVLYEGYGFSVASLYCLGFLTGAITAPVTQPMIDKFGRKKTALLYCAIEVFINMLEQFPFLSGLIVSRVLGGVTTNLLSTVFEAWVDTEYRNRGFSQADYETLMRDSVVVSNLAAIASGYLAHVLAEALGPVGPFEGAVTCTAIAFGVVLFLWNENYGNLGKGEGSGKSSLVELKETFDTIRADSRVLRVCITQGLTMGSLHIFIFLWSPVLSDFAASIKGKQIGLDGHGEPAFGLIFGFFMTAGVLGGLCSPSVRKVITLLLSPLTKSTIPDVVTVEGEGEVRPMAVEFQGALCYFLCGVLLFVPSILPVSDPSSFGIALVSLMAYEFLVGVYFPCEGVIRSLYMPPDARGSMMTVPRIIVNVAVALGVVSTELINHQHAMTIISCLMLISSGLQLSLVSEKEWQSLFGRIEHVKRQSLRPLQSFSKSVSDLVMSSPKNESSRISSVDSSAAGQLARTFPSLETSKKDKSE